MTSDSSPTSCIWRSRASAAWCNKLVACGELKETSDSDDARVKPLALTPKGRRTLAALHEFGRRQVGDALAQLTETERRTVREGLMLYARALRASQTADPAMDPAA